MCGLATGCRWPSSCLKPSPRADHALSTQGVDMRKGEGRAGLAMSFLEDQPWRRACKNIENRIKSISPCLGNLLTGLRPRNALLARIIFGFSVHANVSAMVWRMLSGCQGWKGKLMHKPVKRSFRCFARNRETNHVFGTTWG